MEYDKGLMESLIASLDYTDNQIAELENVIELLQERLMVTEKFKRVLDGLDTPLVVVKE